MRRNIFGKLDLSRKQNKRPELLNPSRPRVNAFALPFDGMNVVNNCGGMKTIFHTARECVKGERFNPFRCLLRRMGDESMSRMINRPS